MGKGLDTKKSPRPIEELDLNEKRSQSMHARLERFDGSPLRVVHDKNMLQVASQSPWMHSPLQPRAMQRPERTKEPW